MTRKIIITSQLLLFLFSNAFSQSDTTVCIDFNPDLNQKVRKNIINIDISAPFKLGISYERVLKKNKTIKANVGINSRYGSYSSGSIFSNLAYNLYLSNRRYVKTKINDETYFVRKQQKNMLSPKGLYVGAMAHFNIGKKYNFSAPGVKQISTGLGVNLGYQFIFFNKIALNTSLQLPFTLDSSLYYQRTNDGNKELQDVYYDFRPKLFLNLSLGIAF